MKKTIRILLIFLALGLMAYSGYKLIGIYFEYAKGDKLYVDYANEYLVVGPSVGKDNKDNKGEKEVSEKILTVDFKSLLAENEDIVGWIYGHDTPINYPVVQSEDNDYYLRRLLDGSYNIAGSIFMDFRNSPDLMDLNTIIYGHNMKNDTMFGSLKEYNNQDYYDKHPVIYLFTPDNDYEIHLIAGYQTDVSDNIYHIPKSQEELDDLYDEILRLSSFESKVSLEEGDRLLTLSTCTHGQETARFVIIGKLKII